VSIASKAATTSGPPAGNDQATAYVARLAVDAARASEPRVPVKPWWEVLIAVAGAAAGVAAFLTFMGAITVWIRLLVAGLPAEQGVAVMSKGSLAVVGAHVMSFPGLISLLVAVALYYYEDLTTRKTIEAIKAGKTPDVPFQAVTTRWKAVTRKSRGTWSWLCTRPYRRYPTYAVVLPVLLVFYLLVHIPAQIFARLKLMPLWWCVILPFQASSFAVVGANLLALRWANHVHATSQTMNRTLRGIRIRTTSGWVLASVIVALSFQLDQPSQLPPATVTVEHGPEVHGLYLTSSSDAVYIGSHGDLLEIPRGAIRSVEIGHAKSSYAPKSLLARFIGLL
jgi:hypothetical protein